MASLKYMISELVDEREKMERAVWQEYLQNKHGGAPKHPATHNSIKQHKNNAIKLVLGASAHITVGQRKIVLSTSKIMSHFWSRKD